MNIELFEVSSGKSIYSIMSVFIFWMEFMSFHSLMRYRQIRSQKNSPSGKKRPV